MGYGQQLQVSGFPSAELWSSVELFQLQHVDRRGVPLEADGVVGPDTWWALENPSGVSQRNGYTLALPPRAKLTPVRVKLQDILVAEYRKDVKEIPDGSNRAAGTIDTYWGTTGIIGQPWCCALVSEMLRRALGRYPLGEHFVSVQEMYQRALELGLVVKHPRPFDIFIQLKSGGKGHTGFGSAFSVNGVVATLEGNAGNRYKHGRRYLDTITAWIDPFRDAQVQLLQELPELEQLEASATR